MKGNQEKVTKMNNKSNKLAYLRRVLCFKVGVKGSNLEFDKRQIKSYD